MEAVLSSSVSGMLAMAASVLSSTMCNLKLGSIYLPRFTHTTLYKTDNLTLPYLTTLYTYHALQNW